MSRVLLIVGTIGLVLAFQNCQKTVSFGGSDGLAAKSSGDLAPVTTAGDPEDQQAQAAAPEEIHGHGHSSVHPAENSSGGQYVCILDGPGKSIKLGLVDGKLAGNNHAASRALCMSNAACLDIASKKFKVKFAEMRGYCRDYGNPNVVKISDADLAAKILE